VVRALLSLSLLATLLLAPRPGRAGPDGAVTAPTGRARCPKLFGGPKSRKRAEARRARLLHMVLEEPSGITIAHSHLRWTGDPHQLEIEGVELVSIDDETSPRTAVLRVSGQAAGRVSCDPGPYRVSRDDAIGRRTRILAVFGDGVLVEHGGRLGYLLAPDADPPRWLVAWSVPGATIHPGRAGGARKAPPPPRRPAPKKRPPPRRKR